MKSTKQQGSVLVSTLDCTEPCPKMDFKLHWMPDPFTKPKYYFYIVISSPPIPPTQSFTFNDPTRKDQTPQENVQV